MNTASRLAVAAFILAGGAHLAQAVADTDTHGGHPPTAGSAPQGGTGSHSMREGTQAGAPGNVVTAAEATVMGGHDVDADGFITKEEAAKNGSLAKDFAKLDVDRNGKLDETEFSQYTPGVSAVTGTAPVNAHSAKKSEKR